MGAQSPTALRRVIRIAAVPTAAFVAFAIWWLEGWGGQATMRAVIVAGGLGFPTFAAVSAGLAARRTRGRQRRAWVYMTIGLAAWTFSELVVVYHRVWLGSVHPVYPSAANAGFLLFPVAACVAMLVLPAGYPGGNWFRILLGRRNRRRSALRGVLGGGAAPRVRRDRGEKLRRDRVAGLSGVGGRDRHRGGFGARPSAPPLACDGDSADGGPDPDRRVRRRLRVPICP